MLKLDLNLLWTVVEDPGKISTNCDVHLAESLFQTRSEKK